MTQPADLPKELSALLRKYELSQAQWEACGTSWEEVCAIAQHHAAHKEELLDAAQSVQGKIQRIAEVHSVRHRVKNPERLKAKIIRKSYSVLLKDYQERITDLVGVRALHMYKQDWATIHKKVLETWELAEEKPIAYVRDGDNQSHKEMYEALGCTVEIHPHHYRSVHYILKTRFTKEPLLIELQVRTLFEECWAEVDHQVAYPRTNRDAGLQTVLDLFNRIAGLGDETAAVISTLAEASRQHQRQQQVKDDEVQRLTRGMESLVAKLGDESKEKQALQEQVQKLQRAQWPIVTTPIGASLVTGLAPISSLAKGIEGMLVSGATSVADDYLKTPIRLSSEQRCTRCGATISILQGGVCFECMTSPPRI